MSSDVAVRDPQGTVAPFTTAMASLADWAAELKAAGQLAEQLCATPFVPSHFRGKPADAAAAILTGHELGLSPMAALRSIFVINGTPGMYAITLRAVLQNRGHRIWVDEAGPERVVVKGQRAGSDHVVESVWTIERARKAGLFSNKKYETEPQNMLTARGTVEVARLIAADALLGMPYSGEELEDMPPAYQAGPASVGQRVSAAEILGTAPAAPAPPVPPAPEPPAEPATPMMTKPQSGKMFALLTERGYADKDDALIYITGVVGREITSRAELTRHEAGLVIDDLERKAPAQPAGGDV